MLIVTLHNLAHTYGLLPSEVMSRATTFDLYALDVATRYSKYQQEVADGKTPSTKPKKMPTQDEMKAMLKRVRGEQ